MNAWIRLEDVPAWNDEDGGARAKAFRAPLCAGFGAVRLDYDMYDLLGAELPEEDAGEELAVEEDEFVERVDDSDGNGDGDGDVKMEVESDADEASTAPGTPSMLLLAQDGYEQTPRHTQTPAAAPAEELGDDDPVCLFWPATSMCCAHS